MKNRVTARGLLTLTAGMLALGVPEDAHSSGRTNDRYIGYQGVLEVNGQPVNGAVTLRVAIFANANDSTACLTAGASFFTSCGLFRQQLALTAMQGAFSAKVGPIQDSTVLAPGRFLAVAVVQPSAIIPLQGMQEILPVFSAQGGEDFIVGRTLTVTSTLTASGNINAHGNVVVGGAGPQGVSSRLSVRRADNNVEPIGMFMPENNTQGVAITWQGVTKVGTSPNADLVLSPKGTGNVQVAGPLSVQGTVVQQCRAGFTAVSDGRLCISGIQGPQRMHNGAGSANGYDVNDGAIATCRSLRARVCTHLEVHQACADGVDPYAGLDGSGPGSNFWYGDTIGDNTYIFAPVSLAGCSQTDNYGNPANAITGSAKFRCCY